MAVTLATTPKPSTAAGRTSVARCKRACALSQPVPSRSLPTALSTADVAPSAPPSFAQLDKRRDKAREAEQEALQRLYQQREAKQQQQMGLGLGPPPVQPSSSVAMLLQAGGRSAAGGSATAAFIGARPPPAAPPAASAADEASVLQRLYEEEDDEDDDMPLSCCECGSDVAAAGNSLVCCSAPGGCGLAYHLSCLRPPMKRRPRSAHEWLCPSCKSYEAERLKRERKAQQQLEKQRAKNAAASGLSTYEQEQRETIIHNQRVLESRGLS